MAVTLPLSPEVPPPGNDQRYETTNGRNALVARLPFRLDPGGDQASSSASRLRVRV